MRELKHLLHLDCETITGETIGDRIAAAYPWVYRNVVKPIADPNLFEKSGRAVVFTSRSILPPA